MLAPLENMADINNMNWTFSHLYLLVFHCLSSSDSTWLFHWWTASKNSNPRFGFCDQWAWKL